MIELEQHCIWAAERVRALTRDITAQAWPDALEQLKALEEECAALRRKIVERAEQ